jgi:hypothetical protein
MPNAEFEETKHIFYDFSKYFYYSNLLYICILLLLWRSPTSYLFCSLTPFSF